MASPIDHSERQRSQEFVALLGQHERQLSAFLIALIPDWVQSDEVLQITRIKLWEQFDKYDRSKDFGAWARTIAFYQVQTHRKQLSRQSRRFSEIVLEKLVDSAQSASDVLDLRRSALPSCLEKLTASERQLLSRCYDSEQTIKQVAESLGRSPGAVRQNLYELRRALYLCVERALRAAGEA